MSLKVLILVVIAIPAPFVIAAMEECGRRKVGAVAIITSGFGEVGNFDDEKKLKKIANDNNIALLGPNIFGLVYPPSKLNASFGPKDIYPGKIAFITQSGALRHWADGLDSDEEDRFGRAGEYRQ